MAKRYIRNVNLDRGSEEEMEASAQDFCSALSEQIDGRFRRSDGGWVVESDPSALLDMELSCDDFGAEIKAETMVDAVQVRGQGIQRVLGLRIAATAVHAKRKKAREFELNTQHRLSALGALAGGVLLALIFGVGEALLFHLIHIKMLFLVFLLGSGLGGAIGHVIGSGIGRKVGAGMGQTTEREEAAYERAVAQWEQFIDELAEEVDAFAEQVEDSPSRPTMI